ncbi:MAG: MBL fold metallo-hydrolase [Alphaproteobacteria bacterium]|nr:MBL fold metallo-hydrolase [Alphaproteobacteria bacterium]
MVHAEKAALAPNVFWHDDWFALQKIAPGITAIGEPKYRDRNWCYLVEGQHQSMLFDTGPGLRNIATVVAQLTNKPLLTLPSHCHYDHVGNLEHFSQIAMADLPILRQAERGGWMTEPPNLFLGAKENMSWPRFQVSSWLPIGTEIDLGARTATLLHTPGHSPDSISLHVLPDNILLVADFIYPGALYAQLPGSNLADYLTSAKALKTACSATSRLFAAHGADPAPRGQCAPEMVKADLVDLINFLKKLKELEITPPESRVNDRMTLLTSPASFASWQSPS